MRIARVIINLSLDRAFDYLIPVKFANTIKIGMQVEVPFNHSLRKGYVLGFSDKSSHANLKSIHDVCCNHPRIPQSLIDLGIWISQYYCCSRENAIRSLLPGSIRGGKVSHKLISLYSITDIQEAQNYVFEHGKRAKVKAAIIKLLLQRHELTAVQISTEANCSTAPIKDLVKLNILTETQKELARDPFANMTILPTTPQEPSEEQAAALDKIYQMLTTPTGPHTLLLYGVTGSGKTEVYLQAIAKTLEEGKESIVLVPEISLTPQTVERFRARFGDMVSVLHSGLSEGERFDEWTKVYRQEVKIVVGARSALFAPFTNLGLIIVDEEHEQSYKQDKAPRYHARDVAVMRGYMEKAVVILGSATPSFESFYNARNGKYELAELTKRIENVSMPEIKVIDIKTEQARTEEKSSVFTKQLIEAIHDRLYKSEQTILFLNRRGYARQMQCQHCGYVAACENCSISFTYHQHRECLTCHLCGDIVPAYKSCPDCQAEDIRYSGMGTEKIESITKKLFPYAVVRRMDSDTMTRKNAYQEVLNEFRRGNINILIGTQMIAKGLHFPNVTLVGIINADMSLYIPDFRAVERTFQLLTQVSGRAGRGDLQGEVLVQTFSPYNPAIQHAINHDFTTFYEEEMEMREQLCYPPVSHLYTVYVRGENEQQTATFASTIRETIQPYLSPEIMISEPAPAPLAKVKNRFRYMMMFRGIKMVTLRKALRHLVFTMNKPKGIDVYIDIDALNMM